MGLFKKKKVIVEKTASQKINEEIKSHKSTTDNLERLKPSLIKLMTHYKKMLTTDTYVYGSGITLHFIKGIHEYPDGFLAWADKLGLTIEPICASTYDYHPEKSFTVRAKSK